MYGSGFSEVIVFLLMIILLFVLFLLLREFWCWYWKQNRIVSLLADIKELLEDQIDLMPQQTVVNLAAKLSDIDPDEKYKPPKNKTLASENR